MASKPVVIKQTAQKTTGSAIIGQKPKAKPYDPLKDPAYQKAMNAHKQGLGPISVAVKNNPALAPVLTPLKTPSAPADYRTDPTYLEAIKNLQTRRNSALGYTDASGVFKKGSIDTEQDEYLANTGTNASGGYDESKIQTENPFSQAALLQKAWMNRDASSGMGMAARGQGYSGALQALRSSSESDKNQRKDALAKAVMNAIAGFSKRRTDAETDFNTGQIDAQREALGRLGT